MRFTVNKSFLDEYCDKYGIEKSVTKKYIKREGSPGHYRYWYKNPDGSITIRGKGEQVKKTKSSATTNEINTSRCNIGDLINFNDNGTIKEGFVAMIKGNTIILKNGGIMYKKNMSDVQIQNSKTFNANDYKLKATDKRATNDLEGAKFIYDSMGETGKEAAIMAERKLFELSKRLKKGDTTVKYMENGQWTAEREKLHNQIIDKFLSPERIEKCTPKNGEKPKLVMFGGRGGSGKSWFTDKERAVKENRKVMFDSENFIVLDADEIKNYLKPPYEGWNAGEVHEESSYLNKKIMAMAKEKGLNIIIDGTMAYNPAKPNKVRDQIMDFKNSGYSTEAHYMFLPLQESCKRAINRFKTKKGDFSGRLVPMNILLGMQDNEKSFDSVKDIVDDWSFRDNQGSAGPKLIAKK